MSDLPSKGFMTQRTNEEEKSEANAQHRDTNKGLLPKKRFEQEDADFADKTEKLIGQDAKEN